ncbi:astakine-like [Aphis craccivora]|uniref:Astakine-like n=1 Tax=Aphis craccivora TaxID=307492 RepID=A0A6G0YRX2_APHCR|nr:astakine-like [Aphis craccivora]
MLTVPKRMLSVHVRILNIKIEVKINKSNMGKLSLAVVMILVATVAAYPSKPSFLGCQSSEDCGVDECCVLAPTRGGSSSPNVKEALL